MCGGILARASVDSFKERGAENEDGADPGTEGRGGAGVREDAGKARGGGVANGR